MTMDNPSLVYDLVEWVDARPRPYQEVMEAWRTSCPRLSVWEDAVDAGFVVREPGKDGQVMVRTTAAGRQFLDASRAA
ncbi:MAG: hypothetical protein AAF441_13255 [Pseudomonadota bacterium]